jgi:hypothetical protein
MESMIAWSLVVIAVNMTLVTVAAVVALLRLVKVAVAAGKLVDTVRVKVPPLMDGVTTVVQDVRGVVLDVREFERGVIRGLQNPFATFASLAGKFIDVVQGLLVQRRGARRRSASVPAEPAPVSEAENGD